MSKTIYYNKKTITSGAVIEQMTYEESISHGYKMSVEQVNRRKSAKYNLLLGVTKEQILERKTESRRLSMSRAKRSLIRLINSNIYKYSKPNGSTYPPIFLTFTFKKDIRDLKDANKIFTLFIKRLNYEINKEKPNTVKYSVVIEFQDKNRDGVIHYHAIFYNLPYILKEVITEIWGHGFIDVEKIRKTKNAGTYVTKYMSKNFEDARLDGHKRYFSSRGLFKPKVYAGDEAFSIIRKVIPPDTPKWEITFDTKKKGKVTKEIYTLQEKKDLKEIISEEDFKKIEPYDIS